MGLLSLFCCYEPHVSFFGDTEMPTLVETKQACSLTLPSDRRLSAIDNDLFYLVSVVLMYLCHNSNIYYCMILDRFW